MLKYAYYSMIQDIGGRLVIGLLVAALIQVAIPDEFFLHFGSQPLLQMLVILIVAVPMYICSTGSIPVAAALIMKGLSPGAALVMLMAGPAVNLASILVVRKAMGRRFTWIYLLVIVGFSILFGLLVNAIGITVKSMATVELCCAAEVVMPSAFALSLGIAIQNVPEGAIISMPLRAEGNSRWKAFGIGALSGIVEPIGGALVLLLATSILGIMPYMLAFAAGAMLYVVVEELVPDYSQGKHSNIGTIGFALGFALMMVLDVVLG